VLKSHFGSRGIFLWKLGIMDAGLSGLVVDHRHCDVYLKTRIPKLPSSTLPTMESSATSLKPCRCSRKKSKSSKA